MTRAALVVVCLATLAGCGAGMGSSVRTVARFEGGGLLRLEGPIVPATIEAHVAMTEHCDGRWRLIGEVESVATNGEWTLGDPIWPGADDRDREIAYRCGIR